MYFAHSGSELISSTSTGTPRAAALPHEPSSGPIAKSFERTRVVVRQPWGGNGMQAPLPVDCQDRADRLWRDVFDPPAEGVRDDGQRFSICDHFQDLVLDCLERTVFG